jgi:hypothetical protein
LGGLAAALNMDFLLRLLGSLEPSLYAAAIFMALAAQVSYRRWPCALSARRTRRQVGCHGGFDNGAIFSLYIAAFVLFRLLFVPESRGR